MYQKSLRTLIQESDHCIFTPCVYDCVSARALELAGFEAIMLSGGELALAMDGVVDYGLTNLTDTEWMVSRIAQSSALPLAADIDNGYGDSPIHIYRAVKRLVRAGACAIQMEDSGSDGPEGLCSRETYFSKVKAAVAALAGTDCLLIARTNADPDTQLDEGCERMRIAHELGAEMTTVVRTRNAAEARYVAQRVPGWKMYPDVTAPDGIPSATLEELYALDYKIMTTHFTLKAAMDGILTHAFENRKNGSVAYTYTHPGPFHYVGMSATAYFDPDAFMAMEGRFTGVTKEFPLGKIFNETYPDGLPHLKIEEHF